MSRIFFIIPVLVLSSCISTPEVLKQSKPQQVELPGQWKNETSNGDPGSCLSHFKDDALHALVKEALDKNSDLKAAAYRLKTAEANTKVAAAELWPELFATAGATRTKRNFIGFGGLGGLSSSRSTTYNPSLDLSWELDLWGRVRDSKDASLAELKQLASSYQYARFSLAANVVSAWVSAIEAQKQLVLAEKTAKNFRDNLDVIERRFNSGTVKSLDLSLLRSNLASSQSQVTLRKRQHDAVLRALEILLWRYPSAELSIASDFPEMSDSVPAGVPSELLERRPDLIAAFQQTEVARKNAGAAHKARMPSISLSASGGTNAAHYRDALDQQFSVWTLAANATQSLWRGGRLKANAQAAKHVWEESLENYKSKILTAVKEVETALANEQFMKEQLMHLEKASEESENAERLSWEHYRSGTAGIATVLESQRRAFESKSALIAARAAYLDNRVDLYLALGGDFELKEK